MADQNLRINLTAFDKTQRAFASVRRGLGSVKKVVFSTQAAVAGLAGAAGLGAFVKSTIETNRSFQALEASLKTFLGSAEKASGAFSVLQEFAAQTPFSLQEVVGGFNRLISVGLNPSIIALEAFGNIASGTGKQLEQFVEAAADAAVGEFERLKEFGIKARSEGDKVVFTFKGVETEIRKDAEAIEGYLVNLGQTEFAGAIAEQSKTLNGAFSNLNDSIQAFQKQIGEGGLNDALVEVSKQFSVSIGRSGELAKTIGTVLGNAILGAFEKLRNLLNLSYSFGQAIAELQNGQISLNEVLGRTTDIYDQLSESQKQARENTDAVAASTEDLNNKLNNVIKTGDVAGQSIREMLGATKEQAKKTADVFGDSFGDAFMAFSEGTRSASDAFADMAKQIIKRLYEIFVVERLVQSISGGITRAFNIKPAGQPSGRANGGSVQAGQPFIVGERGKELFVPRQSGNIVPNNKLGGETVVVNQTINVSTGVSQTVRAEIVQLMPQIVGAAKSGVLDAKKRGGAYGAAF